MRNIISLLLVSVILVSTAAGNDVVPLLGSQRPKLGVDTKSCFPKYKNTLEKLFVDAIAVTGYVLGHLKQSPMEQFAELMYKAVLKDSYANADIQSTIDLLQKIQNVGAPSSEWTVNVYCGTDHLDADDKGVFDTTIKSKKDDGTDCPIYIMNDHEAYASSLFPERLCDRTKIEMGHVQGIAAEVHQGQFDAAKQARLILCPAWLDGVMQYSATSMSLALGLGEGGDLRSSQDVISQGFNSYPGYNTLNGIQSPEFTIVHELTHVFGDITDPSKRKYLPGWEKIDKHCIMGEPQINDDDYDYSFQAAQARRKKSAPSTAVNHEFLVKGITLQMEVDDLTKPAASKLRVTWPSYWYLGILDRKTMRPPEGSDAAAKARQMYQDEVERVKQASLKEFQRALGGSWSSLTSKWKFKTGKKIVGLPDGVQDRG